MSSLISQPFFTDGKKCGSHKKSKTGIKSFLGKQPFGKYYTDHTEKNEQAYCN